MRRATETGETPLGGWATIRATAIVAALVALPVGPALAGALSRTFPFPHPEVLITGAIWIGLTVWLLDAVRVQLKAAEYNVHQGRDLEAASAAAGRTRADVPIAVRPARALPASV